MKSYRQAALRSLGRSQEALRENCRQFWVAIAAGRSSEDAGVDAGVSPAVGYGGSGRRVACPNAFLAVVKTSIGALPFVRRT